MKKSIALSLSDVLFIMLIIVKMPTIVGILTFMSGIKFVLSWVEHGKRFITSSPGLPLTYFMVEGIMRKISVKLLGVRLTGSRGDVF